MEPSIDATGSLPLVTDSTFLLYVEFSLLRGPARAGVPREPAALVVADSVRFLADTFSGLLWREWGEAVRATEPAWVAVLSHQCNTSQEGNSF